MTDMRNHAYGLIVRAEDEYGSRRIVVLLATRERDKEAPHGCRGDGEDHEYYGSPKHLHGLQLDGLGLYGFIDRPLAQTEDATSRFLGARNLEYRNVFAVDQTKAERMLRTLRKVNKSMQADHVHEPGDVLMALAKALKLTFVCYPVVENGGRVMTWNFCSIAEGRDMYRRLIAMEIAKADKKTAA